MKYAKIIIGSCIAVIISGIAVSRTIDGHGLGSGERTDDRGTNGSTILGCRKIKTGTFDCSTEKDKEAAKKVKTWYITEKTIKAYVTKYTEKESCTNASCINARGYHPIVGKSVACPRKYPLGTKVVIEGKWFVCDDRTHRRYDGRFDLFVEVYQSAKEHGKQEKEITIIYEHPRLEEN